MDSPCVTLSPHTHTNKVAGHMLVSGVGREALRRPLVPRTNIISARKCGRFISDHLEEDLVETRDFLQAPEDFFQVERTGVVTQATTFSTQRR